jgi:hypothetical protein
MYDYDPFSYKWKNITTNNLPLWIRWNSKTTRLLTPGDEGNTVI